jgi:phosphohistidine phosphatase
MVGSEHVSRRLLLLRHAAAEPGHDIADADRRLTPAGRQAAASLAERLSRPPPALVLCSPARRAIETAELAGLDAGIDEQLYLAGAATLLERLRSVDDAIRSVLVVGHNPGLEDLATVLSGRRIPLGTASVAALDVDRSWAELGLGED